MDELEKKLRAAITRGNCILEMRTGIKQMLGITDTSADVLLDDKQLEQLAVLMLLPFVTHMAQDVATIKDLEQKLARAKEAFVEARNNPPRTDVKAVLAEHGLHPSYVEGD